jgi:putative membrane protein
MIGIIVRLLIAMGSMWLASRIVPGMNFDSATTLFWAALWLGIVNALVRPLLIIATIPLTIITLGLFLLVINAGMLALVAKFLGGFTISGFWAAFFGALLVSIFSSLASRFIGPRGNYEVMVVRRD